MSCVTFGPRAGAPPQRQTATGRVRGLWPWLLDWSAALALAAWLAPRPAPAGEPWLVQDLNPYEPARYISYEFNHPVHANGLLFLASGLRFYETRDSLRPIFTTLHVSDGYSSETVNLGNLWGGIDHAIQSMIAWRDQALLGVAHPEYRGLLWTSDGTTTGTVPFGTPDGTYFVDSLVASGDWVYFAGYHQTWGLVRTDLSEEGTRLITDRTVLRKKTRFVDRNPTRLMTDVNGLLFFMTELDDNKKGVWRTDGTETGTLLLKSFDRTYLSGDIEPGEIINVNGLGYFSMYDRAGGGSLWKSDGTTQGTTLVTPVAASHLTAAGSTLFFVGADDEHGEELWKSDGTPEGTVLVRDIHPGSEGCCASPDVHAVNESPFLTDVNGTLFFMADDGVHGQELWKSDGTPEGTVMVHNILPEELEVSDINFNSMFNADGTLLFFTRKNSPEEGGGLWRSDGTSEGTQPISPVSSEFGVYIDNRYGQFSFVQYADPDFAWGPGGNVYFSGWDQEHGSELWRTDGTPAGTVMVTDTRAPGSPSLPRSHARINDTYLFTAYEGADNARDGSPELWRIDGPHSCTKLVTDFLSSNHETPIVYTLKEGLLFATRRSASHPWVITDGTPSGTWEVHRGKTYSRLSILIDEIFYYLDQGLWKTDGSLAGSGMVHEAGRNHIGYHDGALYFAGADEIHGRELWKSDGTTSGTTRVTDIQPVGASDPQYLAGFDGSVFFIADDGVHGQELWVTDGTEAGTRLYKDFKPGPEGRAVKNAVELANGVLFLTSEGGEASIWWSGGASMPIEELTRSEVSSFEPITVIDETVALMYTRPSRRRTLIRTDGTPEGTYALLDKGQVNNIYFDGPNGALCFSSYATDPTTETLITTTLYITDGTLEGTTPLASARSVRATTIFKSWLIDNILYFRFEYDDQYGQELWRSDGTPEGTFLLADIRPGPNYSFPRHVVQFNGASYFVVWFPTGFELWRTDGTREGTGPALHGDHELTPDVVDQLTVIDDWLYFSGWNADHGRELWRTDGTLEGTERLTDIAPGPLNSDPSDFMLLDNTLYFSANDHSPVGRELYAIRLDDTIMLPGDVPLELVRVPSGSYEMGSPDAERGRNGNEGPAHSVTFDHNFYMTKTEVTQAQWLALMGSWPGSAPSAGRGLGDHYPAYSVSWNDAQDFIAALNAHIADTRQGRATFRLPSEAEWEYACRAGTATRFSFGDSLGCDDGCETCMGSDGPRSDFMWYCGNNNPYGAKPAGSKLPNAWGLFDMHGNVWEWCRDDWHDNYDSPSRPDDGSPWFTPMSSRRVARGGGWDSSALSCRSANRLGLAPDFRNLHFGFRLARTQPTPTPTPTPSPTPELTPTPVPTSTPDPRPLVGSVELIGEAGGPSTGVAVQDGHVYLGEGLGLVVLDVSDPRRPVQLGKVLLSDAKNVTDVAVQGDFAYVTNGESLWVVDVSNPADPLPQGRYNAAHHDFGGVAVAGNLVYVAALRGGLTVLDVDDPNSPTLKGVVTLAEDVQVVTTHGGGGEAPSPTVRWAVDVTLSGQRAFVAARDVGLQIVDISDPANPILTHIVDTPQSALGVSVWGERAWVADWLGGMQVIDIGPAGGPAIIDTFDTADAALDIAVSAGVAYLATGLSGLVILDVSGPEPTPAATWQTPDLAAALAYDGGRVFVADTEGLRIIEVSRPSEPADLGDYTPAVSPTDVAVQGNVAYAACRAGLKLIDIADPARPAPLGRYDMPAPAKNVAVVGDLVCISDEPNVYQRGEARGLWLLDAGDPTSPTLISHYKPLGETTNIEIADDKVWLALRNRGLEIVDVGDPQTPVRLSDYETTGTANDLSVDGDIACLADGGAGLHIFDVADSSSPMKLTTWTGSGQVYGVKLKHNKAWLTAHDRVDIIDITDPNQPVLEESHPYHGVSQIPAIETHKNLAWYPDDGGFLYILNRDDPDNPMPVARFLPGGESAELVVKDDLIINANELGGLSILRAPFRNNAWKEWLSIR